MWLAVANAGCQGAGDLLEEPPGGGHGGTTEK